MKVLEAGDVLQASSDRLDSLDFIPLLDLYLYNHECLFLVFHLCGSFLTPSNSLGFLFCLVLHLSRIGRYFGLVELYSIFPKSVEY